MLDSNIISLTSASPDLPLNQHSTSDLSTSGGTSSSLTMPEELVVLENSATVGDSNPTSVIEKSMTSRHACPCCTTTLLRHIRGGSLYWRCSHCRAEISDEAFSASHPENPETRISF